MLGLVKTAMRKTISNAYLTFDELKEVFLDVEIALTSKIPREMQGCDLELLDERVRSWAARTSHRNTSRLS